MLLVFAAWTLFVLVVRCNFVMLFLDHYGDLQGYIPLLQMYKGIIIQCGYIIKNVCLFLHCSVLCTIYEARYNLQCLAVSGFPVCNSA
jgi:hypothetical protein